MALGVIGVANAAHFGGGLMGFACGLRRRWVAPVVLGAVVAALALTPASPPAYSVRIKADRDLQDGRLDAAIRGYQQLIEQEEPRAGTWKNYGIALQDASRFEEALEAWRQAIAMDPQIFTPEQRRAIQAELKLKDAAGAAAPAPGGGG